MSERCRIPARFVTLSRVLNAFRHLICRNPCLTIDPNCVFEVLNAFRHLICRNRARIVSVPHVRILCSTPFGILYVGTRS